MVYQGFYEILMITLISRKKLGGYKIMRNTVCIISITNPESKNSGFFHEKKFDHFSKVSGFVDLGFVARSHELVIE